MKINYELKLKDCQNYVKETFFIKRLLLYFLKDNFIRTIICSILFSLYMVFFVVNFNIKYMIFSFFIFIIFAYFMGGLFVYFSGGKEVYKFLDGLDKNYELNIEKDCIKRKSSNLETTINWNNVKDIYNMKNNILIFVSERHAIIIPKRIFETEKSVQDFWQDIQTCFNQYK